MDIPKVIKFSEDGKLFLRAFLIDSSINENDWGVVNSSIPQNIKTFVGMPLVLDENYDHPKWKDDKDLVGNAEYQQKFAIGTIRDVVEQNGKWDAIIEITDQLAREAIEQEDIPLLVSPRILHDPDEPDTAIKDWMGFHLAIVDKPAFGDKAAIKGACYGAAEQCQLALKQAKVKEPCGFCVKKALQKLVTKAGAVTSSDNVPSRKNLLMEDCPDKMNKESQAPAQEQECIPREEHEALKAKFAAMSSAFEQARSTYDSRIAAMEEERKEEKISSVLSAKIADKEELAKKVTYFMEKFKSMDAKSAVEVIAESFKLVPDINSPQATQQTDNSFNARPADGSVNTRAGSASAHQLYINSVIKGANA